MSLDANGTPLVAINTASADELATLRGIGPVLAARIVEDRAKHGAFARPADLMRVQGVGRALVLDLLPRVDWKMPAHGDAGNERSWFFALLLLICLYLLSLDIVSAFFEGASIFLVDGASRWRAITDLVLMMVRSFGVLASFFYGMQLALATKESEAHASFFGIYRSGFFVFCVFVIEIAVKLSFDGDGSGMSLYRLAVVIILGLTLAPLFLLRIRWRLTISERFEFWYGLTFASFLISYVLFVVFFAATDGFTRPMLIYGVITAVFNIWNGTSMLRGGLPLTQIRLALGQSHGQSQRFIGMWLDNAVPRIEDQLELREYLNRKFKPSRTMTALGIALIASGTWLLLAVLEGMVQWVVGKSLDGAFGF